MPVFMDRREGTRDGDSRDVLRTCPPRAIPGIYVFPGPALTYAGFSGAG